MRIRAELSDYVTSMRTYREYFVRVLANACKRNTHTQLRKICVRARDCMLANGVIVAQRARVRRRDGYEINTTWKLVQPVWGGLW